MRAAVTLDLSDDGDTFDDRGPQFTGLQLYRDGKTDELRCRLFQDGMITELTATERDQERTLGFYDFNMHQVPNPFAEDASL